MAMNYTALVASKGTTGSLANWVNYSKLDTATVLEEAQSLLFSLLRVREMKASWTFGLDAGDCEIDLPERFLDPIGKIRDLTNSRGITQSSDTSVEDLRVYDTSISGTFPNNPFTTTVDSALVAVHLAGHDLSQGSVLTIAGATGVGGLTLNGTFPVTSITDDDHLVINVGDTAATLSGTGGGAAASYTASKLIESLPMAWSVVGEKLLFNCALEMAAQYRMLYFRSSLPLSSTNQTNWLTKRYPKLLRVACMAASADYMKDNEEYQKHLTALTVLVQSTANENDLYLRGAEIGTDTPTPGDYY